MIFAVLLLAGCSRSRTYDVCVYGSTSAGVVAAYSAAQCGKSVVLIEPTEHVGGMTTGGLGFTDIGNKQVIKGVAKEFYRKVGRHYGRLEQWIFEPSVADSIMRSYLQHENITVLTGRRIVSADKAGTRITSIVVETSAEPHSTMTVGADYFIDCSYEGDLMARAGVSYVVGRESNDTYGETYNGVELMTGHQFPDGIDPYRVEGDPSSGLLWGISDAEVAPDGTGDEMVQAYNYRICLTSDLDNMIPITRPEGYDSTRYELLLRLIEAQPDKRMLNDYFIWSRMPNDKTDINNRGGFSTDMIGMNHSYPEASYDERDSIIAAHTLYTKGLLWFLGNDQRVPDIMRKRMRMWGYPKDEYTAFGHWTPQLYIREARRMVGEYVATQDDCEGRAVVNDGVAMAAYQMDSHNCQRIVITENGRDMVKNEGNVEIGGGLPYPISYRSITPKRSECTNLLVPVCLSASHIAYGSIRMEPVFMVLGQVAAVAVAEAMANGDCDVQQVDSRRICAAIDADPYLDGSQPDILVDDADAGVEAEAGWTRVSRSGGYGLSYLEIPADAERCSVRYTVESMPSSGDYAVYAYQNADKRLAMQTAVRVFTGDECHDVIIDRSRMDVLGQTSGEWVPLGIYRFEKGMPGAVEFDNSLAEGSVTRADAVLFVKCN